MSSVNSGQRFFLRNWPYFVLLGILFLFYRGIFLAQGAWLVSDHAEQHFPWAVYLAEHLQKGMIPFWTNQIHAGFPITAEGQIGSFYLPNLLFYFLFPIRHGYAWNIVFHLVVSAFGMMFYLKSLDLDNRSALFGTLVYLFGSTLGGAYYNITSLKVLTWFPFALLLGDKMIRSAKFPWAKILGLGFLFSLQLLAGYLQFAAYAILFTGLYLLFRLYDFPERNFRRVFFSLGGIFLAVLLAACISFPQLVETYQLAVLSNRAGQEEGFAYVGSYSPFAAVCLLFPSFEGLFVSKLYLGVLPLFFIIVAFFFYRQNKTKSFYFLVILAFLLALGRFSPLYVLIVKAFHFYSFRTPVKFVFFAGFFLSVLCAMGVQWVMKAQDEQKTLLAGKVYMGFLLVMCLGVLIAFFVFQRFEKRLMALGKWMVTEWIYGKPGHPFSWEHYQDKLAGFIQYAQVVFDPRGKVFWVPAIKMILAVVLILLLTAKRISRTFFYLFSVVLIIADLNFSYSDIQGDYESYDSFFKKPAVVRYLENHLEGARYFNYSENPSEAPLPAAKNMIHGLETVNAYSPLVLKDYYDFFSFMGGVNDSTGFHPVEDDYLTSHLVKLGMLNVKYIVSDRHLHSPYLKEVFSEGDWKVYQNARVMEKLSIVPHYEVYSDREALLARMSDKTFDPKKVVLMEEDPTLFYGMQDKSVLKNSVKIVQDGEARKIIEVALTRDAVLLISQLDYPGWKVWVDEREADLYRANAILTGLPLKQGRHKIVLAYSPI